MSEYWLKHIFCGWGQIFCLYEAQSSRVCRWLGHVTYELSSITRDLNFWVWPQLEIISASCWLRYSPIFCMTLSMYLCTWVQMGYNNAHLLTYLLTLSMWRGTITLIQVDNTTQDKIIYVTCFSLPCGILALLWISHSTLLNFGVHCFQDHMKLNWFKTVWHIYMT